MSNAHEQSDKQRTGWMIERIKPFAFWDGTNCDFDRSCWTTDPNNAPVFENDTSALVVMMALGRLNRIKGEKLADRYRIAEHQWPAAQPSASAEPLVTALKAIRDLGYYGNSSFHPRVQKIAADAVAAFEATPLYVHRTESKEG